MTESLTRVVRRGVETLGVLLTENETESKNEAAKLIREAKSFGLNLRDFLTLAVDVRASEHADRYQDASGFLTGYEAALSYLNLPVRDDFAQGVVLDAAADTFQTYAGTRALFPEVVDDMVRWKYRQDQLETTTPMVSQSRTISGTEMISTVVDDKAEDYQTVRAVAEMGRIPVRTIRTSQNSVAFFKHGGGLRYSYEFGRRARLDLMTPYHVRMLRETAMSKVAAATAILINGDGVNSAAPVVKQSDLNSAATSGKINRRALIKWLINRAKAGTPVDTVVGNWDAYLEWLELFAAPVVAAGKTEAEIASNQGFQLGGIPLLQGVANFAISSAVPDGMLIGLSRGDTMEELIEAGSDIEESERSIANQTVTVVKTTNAGFKLNFNDTRSILNFAG
ncbi:hypothetical protein [Rhizobium sp. Leaf383]|uniref:hypothetical protein n=1 Tax=Rhizobium sp. Leaf383 TaxID=1736357 RepID=UPI00071322F5|nr:hypothetical protein [Rhizobium sp. Leaf383]KQS84261.1 hypothetical protein ASG58_21055 [Rhizobium sp. Leaf383]